jgi:hypothetical protein
MQSPLCLSARVGRTPLSDAFDVDFGVVLGFGFARVERALLPAAFDLDFDAASAPDFEWRSGSPLR